MKKLFSFILLIMIAASASADKVIKIWQNGSCQTYSASMIDSITFVEEITRGTTDGHDWVDLGLPSGRRWATCNVGASTPEDFGEYFSWGETTGSKQGKTDFQWSTYKYCGGSYNTLTKYCYNSEYGTVDDKTILDPEDDAASVNWSAAWCMPTTEDIVELLDTVNNTTITWTTENEVLGVRIASKKNSNYIFIPAAGDKYQTKTELVGRLSFFLSKSISSKYPTDANGAEFYLASPDILYSAVETISRNCGCSVRPVLK